MEPQVATYLINAVNEQVVNTRGRGAVSCLAYSNPAWYEPRSAMGTAFGSIQVGHQILLCKGGKLRFLAAVDTVIMEIDEGSDPEYFGKPVKLLQGSVRHRFDVPVEAVMKRLDVAGLPIPILINTARTGFKQGAFCSRVADETVTAILRDWPAA